MSPERRRGAAFALGGAACGGAFVVPWKLAAQHGESSTMVLVMLATAAAVNTLILPLFPAPAGDPPRSRTLLLALAQAGKQLDHPLQRPIPGAGGCDKVFAHV